VLYIFVVQHAVPIVEVSCTVVHVC